MALLVSLALSTSHKGEVMLQVWLVLAAIFSDQICKDMESENIALFFRLLAVVLFLLSFVTFFYNGGTVG